MVRTVLRALLSIGLTACASDPDTPGPDAVQDTAPSVPPTPSTAPANVVLIIADDLGYADTSLVPGGRVATPQLERLAAEGMAYSAAYAASAVCGPSRAATLTGRYPQRFGFEYNNGPAGRDVNDELGLPDGVPTLGDHLLAGGYATGLLGKWHLGSALRFSPTRHGFTTFVGVLPGTTAYIDARQPGVQVADVPAAVGVDGTTVGFNQRGRTDNMQVVAGPDHTPVDNFDQYLTDDLTDRAVAFLEAHGGGPFALVLSYTAPHTPLQVTARYYDRFPEIEDHTARVYAGMIAALDDGVGQVLDTLDRLGLAEDTLVVFLSDNGCMNQTGLCDCETLTGTKGTFYEGGVRVPFLVRWPAGLAPGTCDRPVSALDVVPTALAAAGLPLPTDLDGVDLGADPCPAGRALYWRAEPTVAALRDGWKLIDGRDGQGPALFEVATDPREQADLSGSEPTQRAALERGVATWEQGLEAPAWDPVMTRVIEACDRTTQVNL